MRREEWEICEHCRKRFGKWRSDQRFCSRECKDAAWNAERAAAMAAWREERRPT